MIVLPKAWKKNNAIPIRIPDIFSKIDQTLSKFIWNNKHPCIAKAIFGGKEDGGITFPNLYLFRFFFLLGTIVYKSRSDLEQKFRGKTWALLGRALKQTKMCFLWSDLMCLDLTSSWTLFDVLHCRMP